MSLEALSSSLQKISDDLEKVGASLKTTTEGFPQLFAGVVKTAAALDTLEGQLDKIINDHAPRAFAMLAEMTRKLSAGEIDMATFEQQFVRLQALNAQGGGFLGDLNQVLTEIRRKMSGLDDGAGAGAGSESGPGGRQPGRTTEAGRGDSGTGDAGSSSTGRNQTGATNASERTGFGASQQRGLVASAIDLGQGGATVEERARILRELMANIRRLRR